EHPGDGAARSGLPRGHEYLKPAPGATSVKPHEYRAPRQISVTTVNLSDPRPAVVAIRPEPETLMATKSTPCRPFASRRHGPCVGSFLTPFRNSSKRTGPPEGRETSGESDVRATYSIAPYRGGWRARFNDEEHGLGSLRLRIISERG